MCIRDSLWTAVFRVLGEYEASRLSRKDPQLTRESFGMVRRALATAANGHNAGWFIRLAEAVRPFITITAKQPELEAICY